MVPLPPVLTRLWTNLATDALYDLISTQTLHLRKVHAVEEKDHVVLRQFSVCVCVCVCACACVCRDTNATCTCITQWKFVCTCTLNDEYDINMNY